MPLKEFNMAEVKGVKIYRLEICYNDDTDEVLHIRECIDGAFKSVWYGDVDLADYFDEEGLDLIDELYDLGET